MSSYKHAPGPWYYDDGIAFIFWTAPSEYRRSVVCHIPSPTYNDDKGRSYWPANARLIAAAPDLLEALRNMLSKCGCGTALGCEVCNAARAAIAKAEGRA